MYDPTAGKLDVKQAETLLDMDDFEKSIVRQAAMIDLLIEQSGITEKQIQTAYEQRLRQSLREARDNLDRLVGDDNATD